MGRPAGLTIARRAVLAMAGIAALRARAQGLGIVDHMPAFWRAYDAASGTPEARARAVIDGFFQPSLDLMRGAGVGRVDLVRWLAIFDPIAPEVRRLSDRFPALWRDAAARFAQALPDFAPAAPIQAMVSFLNFDGRVRLWRDAPTLFIGMDGVIAFNGPGADPAILLAHECFHLYHHQVNPTLVLPGGDPLWLGIWKEGLAVHASAVLHPEATRQAVLLGERALADAGPDLPRRLAAELPGLLDETDGRARFRHLGYGYRGDIPPRSGYLLGWLIVQRVAAGRGLAALARLPAAEAQTLLRRELVALAAG